MKSKEAKALDAYIDSEEGRSAADARTLGADKPNYYLANRLTHAFMLGLEAGKRIAEHEKNTK